LLWRIWVRFTTSWAWQLSPVMLVFSFTSGSMPLISWSVLG
jgi:hypothetical protein